LAATGKIGALAIGTTLESGKDRALGLQVETRQMALFMVYPYENGSDELRVDEAKQAGSLFFAPFLAER
jgi:hypothetical protein